MFLCAWFYPVLNILSHLILIISPWKETITAIFSILEWENQGTEFLGNWSKAGHTSYHRAAWLTNIPFPYLHWYWGNCQGISDNYLTRRRTSVLAQSLHYWQRCTRRGSLSDRGLSSISHVTRADSLRQEHRAVLSYYRHKTRLSSDSTTCFSHSNEQREQFKKVNWLNCRFLCSLKLYTSYILIESEASHLSKKTKTVTLVLVFLLIFLGSNKRNHFQMWE